MPTDRSRKKSAEKRRPTIRVRNVDAVLLRCATIERRLGDIDSQLNVLTQNVASIQAQVDHIADKWRS
jgi:hypothetical protein